MVITIIQAKIKDNIPTVEQIQDEIEEVLIKEGHDEVAKAFIIYREKRSETRSDKDVVVEVGKSMDEYLEKSDWRVNANANSGYSL
jgi:ribonucleoside-triphosphate reductase (formate)